MDCNACENVTVKMGTMPKPWGDGMAKTITFCVTEDCNLRCKYCYQTGKNSSKKMTFEVAKKAVDFFLREKFEETAVVWEFIGGEPFLEVELIDKVTDYIKQQMFIMDHPWFNAYRLNFSSNGLLYDSPKVQEYIGKNLKNLSIGLSVDGNKLKHDMQRVKPDGSGSYDDVIKNVPLWLKQFPFASTKATFSREDLPYLKESIISLWELGIKVVPANVVFEDVWEDGDDVIFETQLRELADYILEHGLWEEYSVRFFEPDRGLPLKIEDSEKNFCGAGKMMAIDCDGNIYPCIRFYDFSLSNRTGLRIGDIHTGINYDKLRPFEALTISAQSSEECRNCEIASGCAWCKGCDYDFAETDTLYQRMTFICKMHKANVRANEYFWDKFTKVTGIKSLREEAKIARGSVFSTRKMAEKKYMQFLAHDQIVPHCSYRNWKASNNVMSKEVFEKGLSFARENGYTPVF
jgi:uncharacterized protein